MRETDGLFCALYRRCSLANAVAKVVELSATHFAFGNHFNLINTRAVDAEHTLNACAVGNFTNGETRIESTSVLLADDDTLEELNALFPTLNDTGVDLDGVTDVKIGRVFLELLLLDLVDDVHNNIALADGGGAELWVFSRECKCFFGSNYGISEDF